MTPAERAELATKVRRECSSSAFRIFSVLLEHTGSDGYAWPKVARLRELSGVRKPDTAHSALRELRSLGVLDYRQCYWMNGGGTAFNLYRVGAKIEGIPDRLRRPVRLASKKKETPAPVNQEDKSGVRYPEKGDTGYPEKGDSRYPVSGGSDGIPKKGIARTLKRREEEEKKGEGDIGSSSSLPRYIEREEKTDDDDVFLRSQKTIKLPEWLRLLQDLSDLLPRALAILKKSPPEFAADWEDWQLAAAIFFVWINKANILAESEEEDPPRTAKYFVVGVHDLSEDEQDTITGWNEEAFSAWVVNLRKQLQEHEVYLRRMSPSKERKSR